MSVTRTDEWLRQQAFPELTALRDYELGSEDVVVVCAGFEDRALEFLRRAVFSGSRGFSAIGVTYAPVVAANRDSELAELVERAGGKLAWIRYDRESPDDPSETVLAAASQHGRVLLDVSGMSRLMIVQLVASLIRHSYEGKTSIVYTEAERYPPNRDEVEGQLAAADDLFGILHFISSGVFGVIIPPDLSSAAMYGQPIRLVAFPTFNPDQFAALRSEINASFFTIVHGTPPYSDAKWREGAIRRLNSVESLREADEVSTSTLDYRETVEAFLDRYARYGDRQRFVVAPTGSKMQSAAIGIVLGFLSDIQVVYPAPRSFNSPEMYTSGIREMYFLPLVFLGIRRPPSLVESGFGSAEAELAQVDMT